MITQGAELLAVLRDINAATKALIDAYCARLLLEAPSNKLRRWQARTLSALRAAQKASVRTNASIRKVERELASGRMT